MSSQSLVKAGMAMPRMEKSEPLGTNESPSPWTGERRSLSRWPVALDGTCYGAWGSSKCLISELSENGISVVCGHIARVGEEFTVAWRLAECETPIQITCVVRGISDQQAGLEFLDATRVDRLRIRHFVRHRQHTTNA